MVELMKAKTVIAIANALFFTAIVALMLTGAFEDDQAYNYSLSTTGGHGLSRRACNEIYVVGEGETLHSISAKCDDPIILENNPHIHDPDDAFPGLVIQITPHSSSFAIE
ncbi:putative LysM domain-containing protein [Helianthus debilis subsp. tardiflorus]